MCLIIILFQHCLLSAPAMPYLRKMHQFHCSWNTQTHQEQDNNFIKGLEKVFPNISRLGIFAGELQAFKFKHNKSDYFRCFCNFYCFVVNSKKADFVAWKPLSKISILFWKKQFKELRQKYFLINVYIKNQTVQLIISNIVSTHFSSNHYSNLKNSHQPCNTNEHRSPSSSLV